MPEYIDRGIMKWQPFDALSGFTEMIKEMIALKNRQTRPILFEDKLQELNETITLAIRQNNSVRITYFEGGYLYYQTGHIIKVDLIKQTILLRPKMLIPIVDVIEAEII